jgi:hypothetical protein
MNRKFILILLTIATLFTIFSFEIKAQLLLNSGSNNNKFESKTPIALGEIINWTDSFKFTNYRIEIPKPTNWEYFDSSIFRYKNYNIIVINLHGEATEDVMIQNFKTSKLFNLNKYIYPGSTWFRGVLGDKLIIDQGDSPGVHGLIIMNLVNMKIILSTYYDGFLKFDKGLLNFHCYIGNKDKKLPPCPEYKTYFENQIFNIQNDSIIHTGEFNCEQN